jgi:hypothetical protein
MISYNSKLDEGGGVELPEMRRQEPRGGRRCTETPLNASSQVVAQAQPGSSHRHASDLRENC